MTKVKIFPHITRFFSATLLWLGLLGLIAINLVNQPKPLNVLGAGSDGQKFTEVLKQEYFFWKEVITQKPEYRDGYIHLGAIALQLEKVDEAKTYFEIAQRLDPNNSIVSSLLETAASQQ